MTTSSTSSRVSGKTSRAEVTLVGADGFEVGAVLWTDWLVAAIDSETCSVTSVTIWDTCTTAVATTTADVC